MNYVRKYIIVDDDSINNIICSMTIKRTLGEVNTKTFSVPEEGLAFIQNEYIKNLQPTILFLDINMPTLTGWEFMEQFEKFSAEIKNQITIYILSSSVDQRDKDKANANTYIKGFISKPLTREMILSVAEAEKV
jgi:two-component SAPR family response regulator